jgi:dethiobiotin synthase
VKNSATHFFITSTGTDVGKTIASAYFCSLLPSFNYWKAVQCGPGAFQQQSYAGDAAIVEYISQSQVSTGIYLETPASPHFAAELANQTITLADITAQQPLHKNLIIEGAGGVAVPLNGKEDIVDLVPIVKAAVILVVRPDLGTISHTRTALDFLSAKNISTQGIVFATPAADFDWSHPIVQNNWQTLAQYVPVLGSIPWYADKQWQIQSHSLRTQTLQALL